MSQRESASPRPFFPPTSKKYLVDYYTGNNAEPENLLYNSEIVIVMYYAPWSRRCIRTRVIFENVARSLSSSSDVSFFFTHNFFSKVLKVPNSWALLLEFSFLEIQCKKVNKGFHNGSFACYCSPPPPHISPNTQNLLTRKKSCL